MVLAWIGIAVAVVTGVILALRKSSAAGGSADVDVGSVSEGWLSEERGRKDS